MSSAGNGKRGRRRRATSAGLRDGMLRLGNGKLGEWIWTFSIPPVATCPGASPTCLAHCYARQRRFGERARLEERNLAVVSAPGWQSRLVAEIEKLNCGRIRIHVSGDFFAAAYVEGWIDVAKRCPHTRFFTYTRSWRIPEILPALRQLARVRNVRLWFSADRDTGLPARQTARVRVAYMQAAGEDVPQRADLVFRVQPLRKTIAKRIGLTLVCPVENGATGNRTDCGRCGVCWK